MPYVDPAPLARDNIKTSYQQWQVKINTYVFEDFPKESSRVFSDSIMKEFLQLVPV